MKKNNTTISSATVTSKEKTMNSIKLTAYLVHDIMLIVFIKDDLGYIVADKDGCTLFSAKTIDAGVKKVESVLQRASEEMKRLVGLELSKAAPGKRVQYVAPTKTTEGYASALRKLASQLREEALSEGKAWVFINIVKSNAKFALKRQEKPQGMKLMPVMKEYHISEVTETTIQAIVGQALNDNENKIRVFVPAEGLELAKNLSSTIYRKSTDKVYMDFQGVN